MIQRRPAKYIKNAVFLSYTSINDFLKCPKAYFLKNIYRDSQNNYRLQITSPYISLGATVHDAIHWYVQNSQTPSFLDINEQFRNFWWKYHGKRGGFASSEEEAAFGKRGVKMLENFVANFHKLGKSAAPASFPKYPLTERLVLTGNLDYVEELPDGTLHIIDFKTGSKDEEGPLQLYIYAILAENFYGKEVSKVSFWYLDRDESPKEVVLDPLDKTIEWLREKSLAIEKAIEQNEWLCQRELPCFECRDYEALLQGKGEFMFSDHSYKKEVFYLEK